jgi:virginiamycin B lyase
VPRSVAVHKAVGKAHATLRIGVPRARKHRRTGGRYVSPATQSIVIALTPLEGTPTTYAENLLPSNPKCSETFGTLACTISLGLSPGTYTASLTTYDAPLGNGGLPTGDQLSANQDVTLYVWADRNNQFNVTLDGVPASVAVFPSASSTMTGSLANGFGIAKCAGAQEVNVLGVDADGYYIMGPGAPTPGLSSNNTALLSIEQPTQAAPNTFVLNANPGQSGGNVTLSASITPSEQSGAGPVTLPVSVDVEAATTICGTISEFTLSSGQRPIGITNGSDGAIWFTEWNLPYGEGALGRIPVTAGNSGSVAGIPLPSYLADLTAIAAGPDSALWFTDEAANQVDRMPVTSVDASQVSYYTIPTSGSGPAGIATGSDGALWFTELGTDRIGRVSTTGQFSEFPIPTANSRPKGIAAGPDGALWFAEYEGNNIGRITTSGQITEYPALTAGAGLTGIASGPDGALWFTELLGNNIGRITTTGQVTEFSVPTNYAQPLGITAGADGAVWFTECYGNNIGRIPTNATSGSQITEYPVPSASSQPTSITSASDGTLWFTEFNSDRVGRVQ